MKSVRHHITGPFSLIVMLWTGIALAQAPKAPLDAELQRIETAFDYGKYADVLEAVPRRIEAGSLSGESRRTLYQLAAPAAFHLDRPDAARRNFQQPLRLDPDRALDPFRVAPPATRLAEPQP